VAASRGSSPYRLLTRIFLRQFLENDLLSSDADRSQMLAVLGASVISLTLFISMFTSAAYAMSIMSPAQAALLSLSDKFFYLSLAMLTTALVAASQWDALTIDQRDVAILEPLPIGTGVVRRAKLTAVALLGAAVAVAVNAFPTIIFPWMMAFSVPQIPILQLFRFMATHFVMTVTAAVFGYLAVIAVRETVSALLGPRNFARVSPTLQSVAIVVLVGSMLLLPAVSVRVAHRNFDGWRAQLPAMAFLGLYESAADGVIADLPQRSMTGRQEARERDSAEKFQALRSQFPGLARRAVVMFGIAGAVVIVATLLNAMRAPIFGAALLQVRSRRSRLAWLTRGSSAAMRAGFAFANATLWRSKTHRLTLACAAAAGLAIVLLTLSGVSFEEGALSVRMLAAQPLLYGAMLVGFRHAIRIPSELRANWGVQLAWGGRTWEFASGVRLAAMVTLVMPALAVTMVPVAITSGWLFAFAHALLGLAGAAILLETMMIGYDRVAFTCAYVPAENTKALVPLYALAFFIGATMFARLQMWMLTGDGMTRGGIALIVLFAILRIVALTRPRIAQIDFNETPVSLHQLGLHN
jgi:hypothetical protein